MPSKPNWLVIRFQEFCRSTALHGWSYLVKVSYIDTNSEALQH